MRVLHLYAGNLYGGVEAMLATLAREGRGGTLDQHFGLAWAEGRLGAELRAAGPEAVHTLGPLRLRSPLAVRRARGRLRGLLAELRPRVVLCHSAWSQAAFAGVAARAGVPLVFWLHDAAGRSLPERWAARVTPQAVVCTSRWAAATLPALYPAVPPAVIHPAVAAPAATHAAGRGRVRRQLGVGADDVVLVQVGRMEPWKGQWLLLEALGSLAAVPRWRCWMVGGAQRPAEARYLRDLMRRAEALGVAGRVAWLGERGDVGALLAAADVVVQPSVRPEPFGIATVEGLYAGLPAVAADHGGVAEVVTDECGVRFAPGDAAALADAIGGLLADAERRARLGAAGPARAAALCDPAGRLAELEAVLRPLAA